MADRAICGVAMAIPGLRGKAEEARIKRIRKIIFEAIRTAGLEPRPIWETKTNLIHPDIVSNLQANPMLVCDISGNNPNVMLELGMRLAFDKPVVIVKDDGSDFLFDVNVIKHVQYPKSLERRGLEEFKANLAEQIVNNLKNPEPSYLTMLSLIPKEVRQVELVPAKEITSMVSDCCVKSHIWRYRGHTARFVRNSVVPTMVTTARDQGVERKLELVVLNPTDEDALERFIRYRNDTAKNSKKQISVNSLRVSIAATILRLAQFVRSSDMHEATLRIADRVSALRLDLLDHLAFVTTEDPEEPAIKFLGESTHWKALLRDFKLDVRRSTEIDLTRLSRDVTPNNLASLRDALTKLDLRLPENEEFLVSVNAQLEYLPDSKG